MQTTDIKKEDKQIESKKGLTPLKELDSKEVRTFDRVLTTFVKTERKHGAGYNVSINVKLFDDRLSSVSITPGGKWLTVDRFDLIAEALGLSDTDEDGRKIQTWIKNVPIRLVKGFYKDGSEYYRLDIIYKQYYYDVHFFSSDQTRILSLLDKDKSRKINWHIDNVAIDKLTDTDIELEVVF